MASRLCLCIAYVSVFMYIYIYIFICEFCLCLFFFFRNPFLIALNLYAGTLHSERTCKKVNCRNTGNIPINNNSFLNEAPCICHGINSHCLLCLYMQFHFFHFSKDKYKIDRILEQKYEL